MKSYNASLVPQLLQILVLLSFLDKAGGSEYSLWQLGHILNTLNESSLILIQISIAVCLLEIILAPVNVNEYIFTLELLFK